jgi:hypothetical protein
VRKLIAIGIIAGLFAPVGIGCGGKDTKKTDTKAADKKDDKKDDKKGKDDK